MIKIADTTSYRLREPVRAMTNAGTRSVSNLGIDPPRQLASLLPPAAAVFLDMRHGVVSLMRQRARNPKPRPTLSASARHDHITLTRAVALRARMAESPEEIAAARHLIRRRYAWRGYDVPERDEQSFQDACASTSNQIMFVATESESTVGTITLGLDGDAGLLAEGTYAEAVRQRRAEGCNVCEVTKLAVSESADSKRVLASLFSLAFATASMHGVTDVFVEVNPRHVVFYRRVLGFVVAAGERFCERVKAPSVLLWLKMEELEQRLVKLNARVTALPFEAQAA